MPDSTEYDSGPETLRHISRVRELLFDVEVNLALRGANHDLSKLGDPERAMFNEWTPRLKELEYGSDEYKDALKQLGPALEHHYAMNRHHPEHWEAGVMDMTLLDLIEMLADWKAAGERHPSGGDILESLKINVERFDIPVGLERILKRTIVELGWDEPDP